MNADRGDRHHVEQAGVDVGEHQRVAERHHCPGRQRRRDRQAGAIRKIQVLDFVGMMISLSSSLTPSAIGWIRPRDRRGSGRCAPASSR